MYKMNMDKTYYTKAELLKSVKTETLEEGFGETALLAAGFVPGIGTFANIALIIKYYREQRYIECGLMLLALIPAVGDILVLPFMRIFRGLKGGIALKDSAKVMQLIAKNPEAKALFLKMGSKMKGREIEKIISKVSQKNPQWGKALRDIQQKQLNMTAQLSSRRGVSTAIKAPFKQKALGKYLIKTGGVPPATKLSHWWNVTYKANRMRRNLITKLIMGSNLLGALGIGSIKELEAKLHNNDEAAKLMQNPQFAEIYNQSIKGMDPAELDNVESSASQSGGGDLMKLLGSGSIGLGGIKMIAKLLVP